MDGEIKNFQLPVACQCQAFECSDGDYNNDVGAHRHEYYELVWCLNDNGCQSVDFNEYDNKTGRFFTLAPGQIHASKNIKNNIRIITFSADFIENRHRQQRLLDKFFSTSTHFHPYFDTASEANAYLEPIFMLMEQESVRNEPNRELMESLLISLLHYIYRYSSQDRMSNTNGEPRVSHLIDLIERFHMKERKCEFYSRTMSMTDKRLNQIAKDYFGKTVTTLIHDRIVLAAKRELAFSTKSVKTIAFELGFEDPSYFGRFYLKQTGMSPLEFRRQYS